MVKKIFSLLLAVIMSCTILGTTSYASTIDIYEYEPGNIMITGYTSAASSPFARLSWKNPLSSALASIEVYSITGDTETLISEIDTPTPGALAHVDEVKTGASGTAMYRLVFRFTDGQVRDILHTGNWNVNKATGMSEIGLTINPIADTGVAGMEVKVAATKEDRYSGTQALKIESNMSEISGKRYLSLYSSVCLTAGAKYNGTIMVKTSDSTQFSIGSPNSPLITVSGSDEWQELQIPEFAAHTNGRYYLYLKSTSRDLYIDDITFNAVDSSTAIQNKIESFDNTALDGGYTSPSNVVATGGNSCVTFTWDTIASGSFVRIYEENTNGELLLRAIVDKAASGTTIYGLENDVEHKFVLRTYGSTYKAESASSSAVYATTIAPDYELGKPSLISNGTEAGSLTDGTYSATCVVKNNKVSEGIEAQLLVAVYDGYKLVKCYASAKTDLAEASNPVTLKVENITLDDSDNKDYNIRVMLWSELGDVAPWKASTVYTE